MCFHEFETKTSFLNSICYRLTLRIWYLHFLLVVADAFGIFTGVSKQDKIVRNFPGVCIFEVASFERVQSDKQNYASLYVTAFYRAADWDAEFGPKPAFLRSVSKSRSKLFLLQVAHENRCYALFFACFYAITKPF